MHDHNNIAQENQKFRYRSRNLPHMFDVDKPIFITYRLKFALPQKVIDTYARQKEEWTRQLTELAAEEQKEMLKSKDSLFFAWFDALLAQSPDVPRLLHREEIRNIITESFKRFDGVRYRLMAYSIMPNHVHVLILPKTQEDGKIFSLQHIVYTWKKFTANTINKRLGRSGSLWQREVYDRLVRNENELNKVVDYILQNPVKAGLVNEWKEWPGNYLNEDVFG